MALKIEDYFAKPMDIEWAKDGVTGDLFIVQARPETIHSKAQSNKMTIYKIDEKIADSLKKQGRVLATGQAVGKRIGTGRSGCIEPTARFWKVSENYVSCLNRVCRWKKSLLNYRYLRKAMFWLQR